MNSRLRKRSGRSWSFRILKWAVTVLTLASLLAWGISAFTWAYFVDEHVVLGAAKGTLDILLATGDRASFAFDEFQSGDLDDPSWMFRPDLKKNTYIKQRPLGWTSGRYPDLMPLGERLGLRLPYWYSRWYPPV